MQTVEQTASATNTPTRRGQHVVVVVCRGPNAGARFTMCRDVTEIGRHADNDIILDDTTVTRRHAELRRTASGYQISDLGSLNGTYVNRDRVQTAVVGPADEIQIGAFQLKLIPGDVYGGADSGPPSARRYDQ